MAKLSYTRDELMASHDYARPHERAGYKLHGGFLADGTYESPRVLNRWPAVKAWQEQLTAKGWPLIDATVQLLKRGNYPNIPQERFLLGHGIGQPLWNSLTITGVIEAKGRVLCDLEAPDFQQIIVDDISQTCTGHLHKGLLYAHGADEGADEVGAPKRRRRRQSLVPHPHLKPPANRRLRHRRPGHHPSAHCPRARTERPESRRGRGVGRTAPASGDATKFFLSF